ncbi:DUF692 domain-containing protein [Burkholderia stagnalis]|uniref:DUF692 domain-containing protein n=1 Tax=Burkholderia stagnalis TaxID=1503054 RepID=UPI00075E15B2|nr:DUF692 family multinuclear iron-containing protein [Burkholderia stagnalis]KVN02897.1 hypothetical protein WT07_13715 [Burkholderia stagnalis]KWE07005.1 hypothetical protein WT48_28485 [Burkholderia stagnalis]KWE11718.1 hypothetical protein WT47_07580 [Burkholderia stagnalis]KWO85688.1 hypothetical protein WU00_28040 [Burkholderia stagnalis]
MNVPRLGVGLQFNPALIGWFPFFDQSLDALEILFDGVMAPLDGPGLMLPGMVDTMREVSARFPLVGHSNYGGDFGFDALSSTPAVRRHVPLARKFNVPWVSNHCFYSDASWCDVWSSPLQFSRAEVVRIANRARALQDLYGVPLAHENAAYYRACPGSDMEEGAFLARVVELSGTYLHLDLHNLYANAQNHGASGYSTARFLDTIPMDRVICIHMAGGRWFDNQYHDLHDTQVVEPVWDLLEDVLSRARPGAVILEYEAEALRSREETLDVARSIDVVLADLERARAAWDRAYGPASRRTTQQEAA